jgi:hypothetical protein
MKLPLPPLIFTLLQRFDVFDSENEEEKNNEHISMGQTTFEGIRDYALCLFGRYLKEGTKNNAIPDIPPQTATRFLSVNEVEAIVREHGFASSDGCYVGGESREEAFNVIGKMMVALVQRIFSNVMAEGANQGLLDCVFDEKNNEFEFDITEKGKRVIYGGDNNETTADN